MADVLFKCEGCSKHLVIDGAGIGQSVNCTGCGASVLVPQPAVAFRCPSCSCDLSAPSNLADEVFHCPNCEAQIDVPATGAQTGPSAAPRAKLRLKPRQSTPHDLTSIASAGSGSRQTLRPCPTQTHEHENSSKVPGANVLTCGNCGGQLQYLPSAEVARCLFCGSESLIRTPRRDGGGSTDGADAPPAYCAPRISTAQIRNAIIEKAYADPAGWKTLDRVPMETVACYFPVWTVRLQVHCSWSGYNVEYRTVIKYRQERKWVGQRWNSLHKIMEDVYENTPVPYEDREIVTHPTNGMHDYETGIFVPAAKGLTQVQCDFVCRGALTAPSLHGEPEASGDISVAPATTGALDAWTPVGRVLIEQNAIVSCGGCCDCVNSVNPIVTSQMFSLLWIPMAIVTYIIQGQTYRHYANLVSGEFMGDTPMDLVAIIAEGSAARSSMRQQKFWKAFILGGSFTILALLIIQCVQRLSAEDSGDYNILTAAFKGFLCLIAMNLAGEMNTEKSWETFLGNRRDFLVRMFLSPPGGMSCRMYQGYTQEWVQQMSPLLRDICECNFETQALANSKNIDARELDDMVGGVIRRAATVLLERSLSKPVVEHDKTTGVHPVRPADGASKATAQKTGRQCVHGVCSRHPYICAVAAGVIVIISAIVIRHASVTRAYRQAAAIAEHSEADIGIAALAAAISKYPTADLAPHARAKIGGIVESVYDAAFERAALARAPDDAIKELVEVMAKYPDSALVESAKAKIAGYKAALDLARAKQTKTAESAEYLRKTKGESLSAGLVAYVRKSAEHGIPEAQRDLGAMLANGTGLPQDEYEAVEWFAKAAEHGLPDAQSYLGWHYDKGRGTSVDKTEALKWYRRSAEQGFAEGQCHLGWCYSNGNGVERNVTEAAKWYGLSAGQGYAMAQHNLATCYEQGLGVGKDLAEAANWYRKSAEQGYANAQYNLGLLYSEGEGVSKDMTESVRWLIRSAEQGNCSAQFKLALCYALGEGTAKDGAEAVRLFRKAAEQGMSTAQYNLAVSYEYGKGVTRNTAEAMVWYRRAAELGDANATRRLAELGINVSSP